MMNQIKLNYSTLALVGFVGFHSFSWSEEVPAVPENQVSTTLTTPAPTTPQTTLTAEATPPASPVAAPPASSSPKLESPSAPPAIAEKKESAASGESPTVQNTSNAPDNEKKTTVTASASGVSASHGDVNVSKSGISAGSMSVGMVTKDGQQWTRLSWRPELEIGKLGIALDLELFLDGKGQFSSEGWNFDTRDDIYNTLYRKIYYIRWDKPGAPFYARVGALEGLQMDPASLVMDNWGNVAMYPGQKQLGVHVQFNDWTPVNLRVEAATNSIQEWQKEGGVLALRASAAPIASTPIPILNKFRIGYSLIQDYNSYANLPDMDNDGCPDASDDSPKNAAICKSLVDYDKLKEGNVSEANIQTIQSLLAEDQRINDSLARSQFSAKSFGLWDIDATLPLFESDFFGLDWYAEFSKPYKTKGNESSALHHAWGLVPTGFNSHLWRLKLGAAYRMLNAGFTPGFFDAAYELQRTILKDGQYYTKDQLYFEQDLGFRQGYFASAKADLWVADLKASYSHLFVSRGSIKSENIAKDATAAFLASKVTPEDDQSFTSGIGLGQTVLSLIPKISKAEVFYNKSHIGQDYFTVKKGDIDELRQDSFFGPSIYTTWGYIIGFAVNQGMTINVLNQVTYQREADGTLTKVPNFGAESVFTF